MPLTARSVMIRLPASMLNAGSVWVRAYAWGRRSGQARKRVSDLPPARWQGRTTSYRSALGVAAGKWRARSFKC